ncbi:MAG TPA: bifunctional 4-hydroxy-2-oxoglutarate aldolase/2-dehydro-3-deoxy-phosphogluconate aldolase [Blastocatellia bacterium]|jgi:2-dehydro-3-deoxyphosphogluconate aldolase/(4S)-4-hydroxy-2-oxoglutarate aldolase|nr:bifunctional 4-hydroxy-2-oxoglutarate aldolase/2-dehydro-3-deoxy-phosphogluconate aldolase [Blastocatellia bacterium]
MNDAEFIRLVSERKVFAVVRAESAALALRAAEAAIIGGIKLVEVALVMAGGFRVISDLRRQFGDRACIGAGSVMSYEQIDRAIKSGAQFMAMPHTSLPLVEATRRHHIPSIVGALTPTEVAAAWSLGAPLVTVFPSEPMGGANYMRALASRMAGVRLAAAGGVSSENVEEYFAAGAFAVAIGSCLFKRGDIQNENYAAIAERSRSILQLAGLA